MKASILSSDVPIINNKANKHVLPLYYLARIVDVVQRTSSHPLSLSFCVLGSAHVIWDARAVAQNMDSFVPILLFHVHWSTGAHGVYLPGVNAGRVDPADQSTPPHHPQRGRKSKTYRTNSFTPPSEGVPPHHVRIVLWHISFLFPPDSVLNLLQGRIVDPDRKSVV